MEAAPSFQQWKSLFDELSTPIQRPFKDEVKVPPGQNTNEWLLMNLIDFFNQINLLYNTLLSTQVCTDNSCPLMTAGPKYKYAWADGKEIKRPIEVSAPVYTDYLMKWVQNFLFDDKNFPSNETTPFAKDFRENLKNIYKRLFRVYAHCYQHHEEQIAQSGLEQYWNSSFKKFYLLVVEFSLVDPKEMMALEKKINQINTGAI